jgi:dipeptidyl aminopeptidase/acylaminoacyl peptidase
MPRVADIKAQVLSVDLAEVIGRVRFVANVDACEKDKLVAFNWNEPGRWEVFLYRVDDGSIIRVTDSPEGSLDPELSPKCDRLLYHRDRGGDERFQVIVRDLASGREEDVTRDPEHYHMYAKFSPDGERIAFTSNRSGKPAQLHVYEWGLIREVTGWSEPVFFFEWLSRRELVYVKGWYNTEVRLVDVESGVDKLLLHFEGAETFIGGVDRESRRVLFYSNVDEWFDIGEIDVDSGRWRWVYRSSSEKESPEYYGGSVIFIEFSSGKNWLRMLRDGRLETLDSGVSDIAVDGSLLAYTKTTSTQPSALVVNGRVVVDTTPEELKGKLVGVEAIKYESFDGRLIEAIVYRPSNWNGSTVIHIHGGPDAHELDRWSPVSQLLALQGYMVILPNYRGSTGYGRSFLHLNDRDLGGGDLRDVVEAAKLARRMGARRVYALGASYGGYLTALALVKYPELWDGGVAVVGFYNWYTEYEKEADYLKVYDTQKMDPNLFHDRSPIFHVEKLKAPILFIHGANDPRCPVEEVIKMAEKLRELGKPYELVIYQDEGHSIRKEENKIDVYRRIVEFLARLEKSSEMKPQN